MNDRKDIYWRAYLIYFGFVGMMCLVFFDTVKLQVEGQNNVFSLSSDSKEKIPTRLVKRIPRRGEILDANGTPLVTSVSYYDIHMDATVIRKNLFDDEISELCTSLASLFPAMSAREYENYIRRARNTGNRYLLIKKQATNEERKKLRKFPIFNKGRLKGGLIDTEETIIRKRPNGEMLRRTLGYFQSENGREIRVGIDGAYNEFLSGENGEEIEQKISTGWKKTGQIVKEAVEGADIVTTIDKEIQEVAHAELYAQLKNQNARNGCAIVMDVKTGEIKAMANLSRNENGEYYESYNHAIGTKEVPGSTFKLASLMVALEDRKVKLTDTVGAYGEYKFYKSVLRDSKTDGYGRITLKEAFELSSNVIARVIYNAYKNEPQAFVDRLKSYGLGEPLGIELEGEPTPTLYSPGDPLWSGISLAWMSIGYEVQQTPLQTLAFYNAVANNGKLVRPLFVKEVRRNGRIEKTFEPVVLRHKICSDKTLRALRSCLEGVITNGTGSALKSAYFDIAGKTGTARILNSDLRYGNKGEEKHQASFTGYFPAEDPIYSCIVVISAPSKDIYGASVSGTVFSAIANKVYASKLKYHKAINENKKVNLETPISIDGNRRDIKTVLDAIGVPYTKQVQSEWVSTMANNNKIDFQKKSMNKRLVPNVVGLSAKDATYLLESSGLIVHLSGYGVVNSQSVYAGKEAIKGESIELILKK
jgi:cell division protein FtsI (penicillin-binding protein 3)